MPRCASCGQDNPDGFRFCGACGAALPAAGRRTGQERKVVTVLFCDLVGFTARSDQADPEDVGALLRPYHARLRAEVHRFGGTLDKFIGDPGGLDDLREALRVALDAGLTYQAGLWYANLADKLGEFDPAAGLATFRDGIGFARRRGLTELAMWMRGATLERRFELAAWEELLGEAEEVVAWYRSRGLAAFTILAAEVQVARVLGFRGRLEAADELVERCLAVADPPYVNHLATLTVAAAVEQARGDRAAAVRQVEEFHRVTGGRSTWGRARCLPDLVRVCAAAGQLPLAQALLDGFPADGAMTAPDRRSLEAAGAVLAEAHGDPDGAAARYQEAADGWRAAGNALEQGLDLLGLGRCLARLGRPEAGPALRQASALFVGLGCGPLLAEADAWLRQAEPTGS